MSNSEKILLVFYRFFPLFWLWVWIAHNSIDSGLWIFGNPCTRHLRQCQCTLVKFYDGGYSASLQYLNSMWGIITKEEWPTNGSLRQQGLPISHHNFAKPQQGGGQWHPRYCPAPGKSLGAPLGVKLSRKAIKRLPKGRKMSHLDASFGPSTCRHRSRGNSTPFPRSPLAGASNETPGLAHKSR